MSRYIPENIRVFVAERAKHRCEYCRIHKDDLFFVYQVDHIISLKHEGLTEANNLAFACSLCNQNKVLDLNNIDRVILRQGLMAIGRYP